LNDDAQDELLERLDAQKITTPATVDPSQFANLLNAAFEIASNATINALGRSEP
jgi:hypothetical protein